MLKNMFKVYVDNLPSLGSVIHLASQVQSNAFLHDIASFNWQHTIYE